jgi:hypothetical protein
MKISRFFILMLVIALSSTSCASIVTRSSYAVDFNSNPQGAEVAIENRDGRVVFDGRTPATVWLESSAGYMRPERYKITYRQPGREPVTTWIHAKIEGWYFGNLLWGGAGVIGMLLIDPLTGAMWRIPSGTEVTNVSIDTHVTSDPPEEDWSALGE